MKKIISLCLSAVMLISAGITVSAAPDTAKELFSETVDMTKVKPDKDDGVVYERELENGDYTVTVTTGGKTETKANIYINGGERVRAYTLEAGKTQENPQPVVITDGKLNAGSGRKPERDGNQNRADTRAHRAGREADDICCWRFHGADVRLRKRISADRLGTGIFGAVHRRRDR